MKRILILGGGTGGALLANLLAKKLGADKAKITVVNGNNQHYYQPGWLYVPFGREDARKLSKSLRSLLNKRIELVIGTVERLDERQQQVILADQSVLEYDYLVIATGSQVAPEEVPGLAEGGHHFYTHDAAATLFRVLREFEGGKIIVGVGGLPYKCPVAPLEFVFLLEEFLTEKGVRSQTQITYTFPINRAFTIESVSAVAQKFLDERGIQVETLFNLETVDPTRRIVTSLEGVELPYDLLVMIPPHCGAKFLQGHTIADEKGWIKTDRTTLRVKGTENIWALGDTTDLPISKAGSTAHFEAPVIVEHLVAAIEGRSLDPKRAEYGGHVMCFLEVGHNQATILDFDYTHPPVVKDPNALMHYLKMAFNKSYFHLVPTGVV